MAIDSDDASPDSSPHAEVAAADLVDAILQMHAECVPIAEIARRFHIRPSVARFIAQRHRLPDEPLEPQWKAIQR